MPRPMYGLPGNCVENERAQASVIEGPEPEVSRVIDQLRVGPPHARVDRVDIEYQPPAGDLPPLTVTA